ncbi:hypothetical protein [Pedobacter duraquae]|uniref:Uncharacterized protein n=1 Tax=Pedobacter duraquae TaxID=425511 RepID=A0A4R6IIW6_9SPHI|nr:hypothetical protein [Pedobacter duraquae]TDO21913.1 hypothetical protein CLV32_3021 [Pedobacter duraquae]
MNKDTEANKQLRVTIATEAFNKSCIIFCSDTQEYYTPREFVDSGIIVDVKELDTRKYYGNISLENAKQALQRQAKDLKAANEKYQAFSQKILSAFDLSPVGKSKGK